MNPQKSIHDQEDEENSHIEENEGFSDDQVDADEENEGSSEDEENEGESLSKQHQRNNDEIGKVDAINDANIDTDEEDEGSSEDEDEREEHYNDNNKGDEDNNVDDNDNNDDNDDNDDSDDSDDSDDNDDSDDSDDSDDNDDDGIDLNSLISYASRSIKKTNSGSTFSKEGSKIAKIDKKCSHCKKHSPDLYCSKCKKDYCSYCNKRVHLKLNSSHARLLKLILKSETGIETKEKNLWEAAKKNKTKKKETAGKGWFHMEVGELTEERKQDFRIIKNRHAINPKRFYKKEDRKAIPKFFQVGKVVSTAVDFYSGRIKNKDRKQTIVDEVLADATQTTYLKRASEPKPYNGTEHFKRYKKRV